MWFYISIKDLFLGSMLLALLVFSVIMFLMSLGVIPDGWMGLTLGGKG